MGKEIAIIRRSFGESHVAFRGAIHVAQRKFDSNRPVRYDGIQLNGPVIGNGSMRASLSSIFCRIGIATLICLSATARLQSASLSVGSSVMGPANSMSRSATAFPRFDLRLQELPKRVPVEIKRPVVPNFDPLIDQLVRHTKISSRANKIMPWVYSSCTEMLVADFEDAISNLDAAEFHLELAMMQLIEGRDGTFSTAQKSVLLAQQRIDLADYTILFLLEMAANEL